MNENMKEFACVIKRHGQERYAIARGTSLEEVREGLSQQWEVISIEEKINNESDQNSE